uniref:Uncharacterized protein n=1 Tax=Haptolina ericina TaxID=156174 RepID=A0A7S3AVV6_9EUKA
MLATYGIDPSRKPGQASVGARERGTVFSEDFNPGGKVKQKQGREPRHAGMTKPGSLMPAALGRAHTRDERRNDWQPSPPRGRWSPPRDSRSRSRSRSRSPRRRHPR